VFLAILLVFVQLGFFIAVPRGSMLLYDRTRFDLLIASPIMSIRFSREHFR
jgi:putative ABC transport system permease protein